VRTRGLKKLTGLRRTTLLASPASVGFSSILLPAPSEAAVVAGDGLEALRSQSVNLLCN